METKTIMIEGREITPVAGETNLYYYLDLTRPKAPRADYLVVHIYRERATARNERYQDRPAYLLQKSPGGHWACECKGAQRGYRCYHERVVAAAEMLAKTTSPGAGRPTAPRAYGGDVAAGLLASGETETWLD